MQTQQPLASAKLNALVHRWMLQQPATAALFCALSRKYHPSTAITSLQIIGFSPPTFVHGEETSATDVMLVLLKWLCLDFKAITAPSSANTIALAKELELRSDQVRPEEKKAFKSGRESLIRQLLRRKKISTDKKNIIDEFNVAQCFQAMRSEANPSSEACLAHLKKIPIQIDLTFAQARWQERYRERVVCQWIDSIGSKEKAAGWGAIAAQLKLLYSPKPATIAWQKLLRKYLYGSHQSFLVNHWCRPSKRHGRFPGLRIRRHQHIALAVDTSGSVKANILQAFVHEIAAIYRKGHRITLLQFDDRIRQISKWQGQAPISWQGRGNTLYDPILRWANKHQPDTLIIFTDALGPPPLTLPSIPLIWAIAGSPQPHLKHWPGQLVFLSAN